MSKTEFTEREIERLEEAYKWSQENSSSNDLKWVNFVDRVNWYNTEEDMIILDKWYRNKNRTITLTIAEQELFFWQYGKAESFAKSLFECIGKADDKNRYKLSLGFPDEVHVFNSYQNVPGYWEEIQKIMLNHL